jgi:diaminohydroxyphosphoribosylaminopyrimidine deaminase/5-amino-6-(5-phosphoribosylamino)uracil reductase
MTLAADTDLTHLERAIELAEGGRGRVSPNPLVGAVICRDEQIVGEGFHRVLGGPHAEVEAIRAAGATDLAGSTMYVSLEPCCHQGRTPPCTEAIVAAGIERVVVAAEDPSEHASGRGLGILRDEGIEVVMAEGDVAHRARLQNQPFRKHARTGRPWVLFKSAMTLDGKVATRSGDSKWISGEESRRMAHHWRAQCDAVAVGIGTALADDPLLTARIEGVHRQPRRVVFDSLARLPLDSQLVSGARRTPLTVVVSRAAPRTATDALEVHGVEVIVAPGENEPARVRSALDQLGASGIGSIVLEGGPHLGGAFLDADEVDEVRLFLAPMILGGRTARDPLEGEGVDAISDSSRALTLDCERVGEDLLVRARMKEW